MVELRDILESEEMKDVIAAINSLKDKFGQTPTDAERHSPVTLSLAGKYKAEAILRILLDENTYYPGYKEVLAAGFGGWLIAPRAPEVREALMIQAALTHMDRAESAAGIDNETPLTMAADIAARYIFTGSDFLIEIYDYLGGYQAFSNAPSFDELWAKLETTEKTINTAARALAFLHHAIDRFERPLNFEPSLNKAVLVLDELKNPKRGYPYKERYVSRSLLHQRWSKNKRTLALIYAASTIRVNRKSLLQVIIGGFFSFEAHRRYFDEWIGRARYVAAHIFARMADHKLQDETFRLLGEGVSVRFAAPKLDREEQASFEFAFRNYINA